MRSERFTNSRPHLALMVAWFCVPNIKIAEGSGDCRSGVCAINERHILGALQKSLLQNYTLLGEPLFNQTMPMMIGVGLEAKNINSIDILKAEVSGETCFSNHGSVCV